MASARSERRLAAIMFTDIVGYTALVGQSEETGRRVRQRHGDLLRPLVERYHGEWVQNVGDETLSSFPSAVDAVNSALAIQDVLQEEPDLGIRIGIHIGDIVFEQGSVHGDGVNVASRIRPLAEPGAVCLSEPVYDAVKNQSNLGFEALGPQSLKNVDRPVRAYIVTGTPATPSSITRARRALPWRGLAAAAGVLIALAAWWLIRPVAVSGPIRSIAVLPLDDYSGDPDQKFFSEGMTEALISELARLEALSVVSRTSVMQYRGTRRALPEIAAELGVGAILEGSVLRSAGAVRITVQLIDARTDRHLWSESYERPEREILKLQGEVASAIAREIQMELDPAGATRTRATVDPQAYENYLKGAHFLDSLSAAEHASAVKYLERAVEQDPNYAPGWALLAFGYT